MRALFLGLHLSPMRSSSRRSLYLIGFVGDLAVLPLTVDKGRPARLRPR